MKTFRGIMEVSSQVCIGDIFNPNLVFDTSKGIYKCYVEEENAEIIAIYLIKEGYKNPEITNNYSIILSPSTFIGFFNDDYSTKKAQNIKEASQYVPLENLCLSPQCGFASCEIGNKLTEDEQWAKVKLVKKIAEEIWG